MALCLSNQYFHRWSTGPLESPKRRKYFSGNQTGSSPLRRFPLLCCGNAYLVKTHTAAMMRTLCIDHRRAAQRWRATHSPLSPLISCLPIFLLGSSLPARRGPVSLHYLHVRRVPEGGCRMTSAPADPAELLSPSITPFSILDGAVT